MKTRNIIVFTGAASALIVSAQARAVYLGLALEYSDPFFSNHPSVAIRDAWNAGPVNQYQILRLYANFNSPADRVNAAAGTLTSPFHVTLSGGTFYNFTEDVFGETLHFNVPSFFEGCHVARAWDSYVTIGNAFTPGAMGLTPGFASQTNNLGYNSSSIGPLPNQAWFVTPNDPQGQAVATAPGQAPAPPGIFRVLLAQFTVSESTAWISGNVLLNINGQNFENQSFSFFVPAPATAMLALAAFIHPRRRRPTV